MSAPGRSATVALPHALAWAGAIGIAALTIVLYLLGDGPWPASTMERACIGVGGAEAGEWGF
jgi:hypothetical protein